jgi:hypothetical protein
MTETGELEQSVREEIADEIESLLKGLEGEAALRGRNEIAGDATCNPNAGIVRTAEANGIKLARKILVDYLRDGELPDDYEEDGEKWDGYEDVATGYDVANRALRTEDGELQENPGSERDRPEVR